MSETPILDLAHDPPKVRRPWWAYAVWFATGILLVIYLPGDVSGLLWFPVLYASIAAHEFGHLIAARLVGMEAGGIVIGGLMILKSGDRWVTRFEWRRILSGGLAKPLPKKGDFDPARYAWMVAGGPLVTLLLTAVSGVAFWRSGGATVGWLSTLWWINAMLCVSCLLPSGGLNKSDGARLRLLLRNPEESRSWIALLQVQTEETAGVLPRDWDAGLFEEMMKCAPHAPENSYRHLLAFYRRLDQRQEAAALAHMERALACSDRCGRLLRHACFLEASCCSAIHRGDAAKARTWLARAVRIRKPVSKHGVEAAIAMAECRYRDALREWDAALAFLAKSKLDSGLVRFGRNLVAGYQARCREALEVGGTADHVR